MTIKLHVAIIEAKGLKGSGLLNRPQDPYCVLTLVGHGEPQQARSEVSPKTNAPRWESPAFVFTLLTLAGMPLELSVWNDATNTMRCATRRCAASDAQQHLPPPLPPPPPPSPPRPAYFAASNNRTTLLRFMLDLMCDV